MDCWDFLKDIISITNVVFLIATKSSALGALACCMFWSSVFFSCRSLGKWQCSACLTKCHEQNSLDSGNFYLIYCQLTQTLITDLGTEENQIIKHLHKHFATGSTVGVTCVTISIRRFLAISSAAFCLLVFFSCSSLLINSFSPPHGASPGFPPTCFSSVAVPRGVAAPAWVARGCCPSGVRTPAVGSYTSPKNALVSPAPVAAASGSRTPKQRCWFGVRQVTRSSFGAGWKWLWPAQSLL